jgi:hypothetical protein
MHIDVQSRRFSLSRDLQSAVEDEARLWKRRKSVVASHVDSDLYRAKAVAFAKLERGTRSVLGYGGGAVLGALAPRAYQNYKEGRPLQTAPTTTPEEISHIGRTCLSGYARLPATHI